MIERITQSFMCDMREYKSGDYCGNLMRAKYVDCRLLDDQTDSMKYGSYFEYIVSGALPKNGVIPEPEYMASAVKKNGGKTEGLTDSDMYSEYRKAKTDALQLRAYLEKMGLEIVHAGKKYTKGRFEGTLDLIVRVTRPLLFGTERGEVFWDVGQLVIIDLKYSGMLYDRWEKLGWMWSNIQKEFHGTQAKQYHFVGGGLPFAFWVTQPAGKEGEPAEMRLFVVPITEDMIEDHIAEGNKLYADFKTEVKIGLVAKPSLKKCLKCILRDECKDKHEYPHPEIVDLNFE